MGRKNFLEIGKIVRTHGVRGYVKLVPWCDDFSTISGLSRLFFDFEGKCLRHIESVKSSKNAVIIKFSGVDSIESAQQIVGLVVYVYRDDIKLSKGRYFIQDLIGVRVYDIDRKDVYYGKVVDVLQPGANDVYRLVDDYGVERLVPVIDDVVIDVNLHDGLIYIRPLEGLFYD